MNDRVVPPPPPPPPPPPKNDSSDEISYATGGRATRAVDPNQIDVSTVLVTTGHLASVFGCSTTSAKKRLNNIEPFKIDGALILYRLIDVVNLKDARTGAAKVTADARNNVQPSGEAYDGIDFNISDDEIPVGMSPAQLKLFYQAKRERESFLKAKMDNDKASGDLTEVADVEQAAIAAFKIVSNFLENMGDILVRDGAIASEDVPSVNQSVDKIREQLADAMKGLAEGVEDSL